LKKLGVAVSILLFFLLAGVTGVYLNIDSDAKTPAGNGSVQQVVTVRTGQAFKAFSVILYTKGLILHPIKFRWFARIKGYDKHIKAGEYKFSNAMTPEKILQTMVEGKVLMHRMTIPEGYNLRQVARAVEASGLGTEADFFKTATDPEFVHSLGIHAQTVEGYLFPDTYYFTINATPKDIIRTMIKRFREVFTTKWKDRAKALGMTIHQVMTLASIIEKESGAAGERPIISSVFHNRLKRKMRLESDPTVIYGIRNYDGNITRKDLESPTPYNTYTMRGLPPGPISNAGVKSIEAALYPADTQYLYFVSKKDGTHYFSSNFKEHEQAVRRYQLSRH
jgi:peptidoglycan lytic transglycosylase G